jgi:predicted RNA binding protein YcfA (HicA-like mRNA interferase family)
MPRRLPRDISGDELVRKLSAYGYSPTRQSGSHVRLTRISPGGEQHLTVPQHKSLRVGTLNAILNDVAAHVGQEKQEIIDELFD